MAVLVFVASCAAPPVQAMSQSDVMVAARILGFLEKPPSGELVVGIVQAPGNRQSQAEAADLQQALGSGLRVGNIVLKPLRITADDVGTADVKLFFLTSGVVDASKVAAASAARKIPCITGDMEQVRQGNCGVGVRSMPTVEILVNRLAATNSGLSFATAFRVMITEF